MSPVIVDGDGNVQRHDPGVEGVPPRRHNYEPKTAEWVLREADRLIHNDRNDQYGDALWDYTILAEYWTTYLKSRGLLKEGVKLKPKDPTMMLSLAKIRRETHKAKPDNIVDGIGYLALSQKIEDEGNLEELLEDVEVWKENEYDPSD